MPTTSALKLLRQQLESSICYHFKNRADARFASQVHVLVRRARQVRGLIESRRKRESANESSNNLQDCTA